MKTRITMIDGSQVTTEAAIVRHAVRFVLSLLSLLAYTIGTQNMSDEAFASFGFLERSQAIVDHGPSWGMTVNILLQIWVWSEFVSMMFNKKRRAIHDFMAKTVVVRR
jgi:uncharacterized RDD family membrane protein YckC